jgi:streptogramin lyase
MMGKHCTAAAFMFVVGALFAPTGNVFAADAIEFAPVPGFPRVPAEITLGRCSAVAVDGKGQVYLFHRGKSPIVVFDENGEYVRAWGNEYVKSAHGLRLDRDGNIWVTDIGHHLVMKFDPAGKLLLSLGTIDKPGKGLDQFDRPTDIAFGPHDEVYVSDGYGNTRVMEFDQKGKFVRTWGTPGKGPGEFNLPHAIRVDAQGRILVGDRENKRIQVFDREGNVLAIWPGFAPYGIELDRDGTIFVADALANQVLQLDSNGKVVHAWGGKGKAPGEFDLPHMLALNRRGDLFVAEVNGQRMQKFVRK